MAHDHSAHDMMAAMSDATTTQSATEEAMTMSESASAEDHAHGGNMAHGGSPMAMMMQMYFYTEMNATVLFKQLRVGCPTTLAYAIIAIVIISIIYEGLKALRDYLNQHRCLRCGDTAVVHDRDHSTSSKRHAKETVTHNIMRHLLSPNHAVQTVMHMAQIAIGYSLMLIFMTYQVYLCVAVVAGCGLGYFMFGWISSRATLTDHCG